jgi:hypothetical protein
MTTRPKWIYASVCTGAAFFVAMLILSAVFDPKIRVLHTLQALIYVAVIFLARKDNAWGYGAGVVTAALWNYINVFITTFIANGLKQFSILLGTGHMPRPDQGLSVVAASAHFLLIFACLAGFLRTRPGSRQWAEFLAGGVLSVAYFCAIIATTGPQYIGILHRLFHV